MSTVAAEAPRWSRRHWLYAVAGVTIAQAALIYFLAKPAQRPPERPIFRTSIQLTSDEDSLRRIASLPGLSDPTLLAMPSVEGFSGSAWLKFPTLDYKPAEWTEPAYWLALETQALTASFTEYVGTNVITPLLIADKPLPPLQRYEPNFPPDPVPTQSLVRIEGELAGRKPMSNVALKSWVSSEILSNTVVQAAVDAAGFTFSATLLASSGSTNADQQALKEVANARFRPAPNGTSDAGPARPLTWGRWIFQWHTLPVAATNLAALNP